MSVPALNRRTLLIGGLAAAALGTVSAPAVAAPKKPNPGWVESTLRTMTRKQKIGQLFVQEIYGSSADVADQRNLAQYGVAKPSEVIATWQFGGAIYFAWADSFVNPLQTATLSNALQRTALAAGGRAPVPLSIATDQEQGVVTRFGPPATQFPGSMALGATRSGSSAQLAAAITGLELRAVGINVDFAPCSDVNVNAENPVIGVRSFGSNPQLVAQLVGRQVAGYQDQGRVSSSTKHFPGHGDTATDSHTGLPVITHSRQEWERIDAPPFRAAIAAGVDMVMTAHLVMPAFDDSGDPATLSKPIITGLLREELGYDGVVITDSLAMEGVRQKYDDGEICVRALEAGVDQLLMSPDPGAGFAAIEAALADGRLTVKELDAKVRRILTAKQRRGFVSAPYADLSAINSIVGAKAHQQIAAKISEQSVTLIKNDVRALPLRPRGKKIFVTGYGETTTRLVGEQFANRGAVVSVKATGTAPSDAVIAQTVSAAAGSDVVVVLTNKASDTAITDVRGAQTTLVKALLGGSSTVVVVAVRDPYDINRFPEAPTYVATYSYSPVTPPALVRVLTGEVSPAGKLPVDIPADDDPSLTLYPYGHGLGY